MSDTSYLNDSLLTEVIPRWFQRDHLTFVCPFVYVLSHTDFCYVTSLGASPRLCFEKYVDVGVIDFVFGSINDEDDIRP